MPKNNARSSFSLELKSWLDSSGKKTVKDLDVRFGKKSFAIAILLFMVVPALPLPTGGVSHVLEFLAVLVALGLVAGRDQLWLPKRWQGYSFGGNFQTKALRGVVSFIGFFEKFSRPRMSSFLEKKVVTSAIAIVIIGFCVAAALAPPFSGLDTLPAMGVVIIALSLILEDILLLLIGIIVGTGGVVLTLTVGEALFRFIKHLF